MGYVLGYHIPQRISPVSQAIYGGLVELWLLHGNVYLQRTRSPEIERSRDFLRTLQKE